MKTGIRLVMLVVAGAACAAVAGCGGSSMSPAAESTASTELAKTRGLIAYTHQDSSGIDRIYVIRADGKGRRALTTHDSLDAVWSPDGTELAYLDHFQNLVVMNADGSGSRIVSHEQGIGEDEIASWSPDGEQLVFGAKLDVGPDAFFIVNADGTGKHRLGASGSDPVWSPDGKQISFSDEAGRVAVIGVDGHGLHRLIQSGCSTDPARWSPDGKQIAFVAPAECLSGGAAIEVMNADGSDRHRITPDDGAYYGSPAWSADGKQIVFSRGSDFGSIGDLYIANADGSGMRSLTKGGGNFDPSWQQR
jgi:Tol biopolymer transport system component